MYLTKDERQVLWKKYKEQGYDLDKIDKRINEINTHLGKMIEKYKLKGMSEEDINVKFKEEFAKMVETDELMIKGKGRKK